ncbi:MAG: DUF4892 domain-containing protein [Motiliproteus sp.]
MKQYLSDKRAVSDRVIRLGWASGWLFLLFGTATLQAASDVRGSSDLDWLSRYPNSWIVNYSQQQVPEYILATGSMKKVNGVVAPEKQLYLSGSLTRITYRLPTGHSSQDAFAMLQQQLTKQPAEVLFQCQGRFCGESNQWANFQFKISKLYGIDREQDYLAIKLTADTVQPSYLALYTVKRGNKRVYAHIDLIEPVNASGDNAAVKSGAAAADSLLARLQATERVYPQLEQIDVSQLQEFSQWLTQNPQRKLFLIGHSDAAAGTDTKQATQQAEQVKQWLLERGIKPAQVEVFGVGALAPPYDNKVPAQRVEWLLSP